MDRVHRHVDTRRSKLLAQLDQRRGGEEVDGDTRDRRAALARERLLVLRVVAVLERSLQVERRLTCGVH